MGDLYLYLPIHVNFNIVCTYRIDNEMNFCEATYLKEKYIQIYCVLTSEMDWTSLLFQTFFLEM